MKRGLLSINVLRPPGRISPQYEKGKDKGGGKGTAVMSAESAALAGRHLEYGTAMVAPELIPHISKEAEREVLILKQIRKARGERASASR